MAGYGSNDPVFVRVGLAGPTQRDKENASILGFEGEDIFDITNSLRKFEYELASPEEGNQEGGFNFKFELVNLTERFEKTILDYYSHFIPGMKGDREESFLNALPSLVIQWGYGDGDFSTGTSRLHVAVINEVRLTYNQAREKVLTIEATDILSHLDAYQKWNSSVRVDVTDVTKEPIIGSGRGGKIPKMLRFLRPFEDILEEVIKRFLRKYPLIRTEVSISQDLKNSLKSIIDNRIQELVNENLPRLVHGQPGREFTTISAEEQVRLEKMHVVYDELFEFFGFSKSQKIAAGALYYEVTFTHSFIGYPAGLLTGPMLVESSRTEMIAKDQIEPVIVEEAKEIAAANKILHADLPLPLHIPNANMPDYEKDTYGTDAGWEVVTTIEDIGSRMEASKALPVPGSVRFEAAALGVFESQSQAQRDRGMPKKPLVRDFVTSQFASGPGSKDSLIAAFKRGNQENAQDNQEFQKTVTDSVAIGAKEGEEVRVAKDPIPWSKMSDEQRAKLADRYVMASVSDGRGIKNKINKIVYQINKILPDPTTHYGIFQSDSISTDRESTMKTSVDKLEESGLVDIFRVFVGPADSNVFDPQALTANKNEDMQIFSFPGLHISEDPLLVPTTTPTEQDDLGNPPESNLNVSDYAKVKFEYGDPSYPILEFDYKGDLAAFSQMLAAVGTTKSLKDNAELLKFESVSLHVGHVISELVATSEYKDAEPAVRNELSEWAHYSSGPIKISQDTLNWLTQLVDKISRADIKKALGAADKKSSGSEKVFVAFIQYLQNESAWRSFFKIDESKSTITAPFYAAYGRTPTGYEAEPAVYVLAKYTMFDAYIGMDGGKREILTYLMGRAFLMQYLSQVRVKLLGIPEMDMPYELTNRIVQFNVRDISRERFSDSKVYHWITGAYNVLGVIHTISPEKAYTTELLLFRSGYGSPVEATEVTEKGKEALASD